MYKYIAIMFLMSFDALAQRVTHPRTSGSQQRSRTINNGYAYGVPNHSGWRRNNSAATNLKYMRINLRFPQVWTRHFPTTPTTGGTNNPTTGGTNNHTTGGPNKQTVGP